MANNKAAHSAEQKKTIAFVFGGRSGEHDVSLMTAESVLAALDRNLFEPVLVGITRDGRWFQGPGALRFLQNEPDAGDENLWSQYGVTPVTTDLFSPFQPGETRIDGIFPLLHGPYGEDGTVQGLFQLAGVPYVGAGVAASAASMDKVMMKGLFRDAGLPVVDDVVVLRSHWRREPDAAGQRIATTVGFPCFVKPANLGSSVGISKVTEPDGLDQAMEEAARHDRKIIVERSAEGYMELECSILGNDDPDASVVGEVVAAGDFYDYESKYFDERSSLVIPAAISEEAAARVQQLAIAAFKAVDASGLSRVDFFFHPETEHVFVNEINTMPGFTRSSMYPKLWEASGLGYTPLLTRLIQLAFERFQDGETP